MHKITTGIILLAAGSSSRMGHSKQLLIAGNEPLLVRATKTALAAGVDKVVVVLGSEEKKHLAVIKDIPVEFVTNKEWQSGMGSSIKAGVNFFLKNFPSIDQLIIMVCDQPHLSAGHLKKLIQTHEQTGKPIVASGYSGTEGVPVLFERTIFNKLLALQNEQGAKKIIKENYSAVAVVDFPLGEIDLDTPEEYNIFLKKTPSI
jgi:molybdenum cofactor cytidylyltransferase